MHQGRHTMGEIIDKTKGKIAQVVGRLTGNKRLKVRGREGRTQGQVEDGVKDAKRSVNGRIRN
jgi:uncharacterized protein YjbJ (UPF0337 family)